LFARALIVGLAAFAVVMTGCGESAQEKAAKARHTRELVAQAKHRQAVAKAAREYEACRSRIWPFIKSLKDLKGHQEIGLTESDYASRLGDTQAIRQELPKVGEVSFACAGALISAMRANIDEIEAEEYWSGCIESLSCDEATQEQTIQADWSKADDALEHAEGKLEAIRTPPQ
jgi:hypothetical protein